MMWLMLSLALVLRLPMITHSLWLDEAIQALALKGQLGPLSTYALGDFQPPLYHLLGYLWTRIAGYSELSLRTISLVAGLGTVYFLFRIGKDLWDQRIGIIAGLLAATNPLLIYYSQEGRTYALTTFLVTASMYYFFKIYQNTSNRLYTIYYILYTTLYLWTSYLSWFLWFALLIYLFSTKRYRLLLLHLFPAATLLFWFPSLFSSLQIGNSTRSHAPEWGRVVGGISWKSLPLTWVKFVLGRISFTNKYLYGIIVIMLGSLHLFILNNFRKLTTKSYLLSTIIIWLLSPLILGVIFATFLPVYQYFRVLFALPAYLLLLAIFLSKYKSNTFSILLIASQLMALIYFWFTPHLHKEDWRQLVSDLPPDAVVAMPSRAQSAPLLYYGFAGSIIEPSHEEITGNSIYYIRYVEDLFDTKRLGAKNFATNGYTITSQKVYPGIQVDIYENRN